MRKIAGLLGLLGILSIFSGNYDLPEFFSCAPISVSAAPESILPGTISVSSNSISDFLPQQNAAFDADVLITLPEYSGQASVTVNGNLPFFTEKERSLWSAGTEYYSDHDHLHRCQVAYACIGPETMPGANEVRGSIGMVKPSGWHTVKYPELIDDLYLYNRCHLIGWQLGNENANEKNLITGTRYLNVTGMLPYENLIANYVKNTGNHVLYRVTPYFNNNDLVARGVLLEGESLEDDTITFCVWCYNVQPGIIINYATGESTVDPNYRVPSATNNIAAPVSGTQPASQEQPAIIRQTECSYILNTNTKRIHLPSCSSVNEMKPSNRKEFSGDISTLLEQGYRSCGRCHPF